MNEQPGQPAPNQVSAELAAAISTSVEAMQGAQQAFEAARANLARHDDEIAKFAGARDAAKQEAEAVNAKIRTEFRSMGLSTKDAVKLKAARNGHLADAENFQMLVDDLRSIRTSHELAAHEAAAAYVGLRRAARQAALARLTDLLASRLPDEFLLFVGLVAEEARLGDSTLFNSDSSVHEPIEFALRELNGKLRQTVKDRGEVPDSSVILPPAPDGVRQFVISPIRVKQLRDSLAGA